MGLKDIFIGAIQKVKKGFDSPYRSLGLNYWEEKKLKHNYKKGLKSSSIKGYTTWYENTESYIHSLHEIFFSNFYSFKANNKSPYIIDCGAYTGFSILYFKLEHPDAKILAFEPDPNNLSLLRKNTDQWGFPGIEVKESAIWTHNGTISFDMNGDMGGAVSKTSASGTVSKKEVSCTRLKDLLSVPIDLLKIDIEGAEYDVLKDCKDSLTLVKNLFIEYHGSFDDTSKLNELLHIVELAGFSVYIKEANNSYPTPFNRSKRGGYFDVQLNLFCFRKD